MNEAQFRESLRLGLGRAILYARLHDLREFRDVILDACLHCYSYDIQIEGTRAPYMYDLVGCLPDKDFYYDEVLKSLARLAFDGNEEAKRSMYDSYNSRAEDVRAHWH